MLSDVPTAHSTAAVVSISQQVRGDSLTISVDPKRTAGAIASVRFRGIEYVDNFDHGRQIQSAVTLDGFGECLNPTEAGAYADRNANSTSSKLRALVHSPGLIRTVTQAAYWLAPGQSFGAPCGPGTKSSVARNRTTLSDYTVARTLSFYGPTIPNMIRSEVRFETTEIHSAATFEGLTGYLPASFDTFLRYDRATRTLRPLLATDQERLTTEPIIVSREDGTAALGVISPSIEKDGSNQSFYGYASWSGVGGTSKWACIFIRQQPRPSAHEAFECDFAVGTIDEVIIAIDKFSPAKPLNSTVPVFGFYKAPKHFYTLSYSEGARAGYSFDRTAFHLQSTEGSGLQPIYRCYNSSADDHFASLRSDCDGYRTEAVFGYAAKSQRFGWIPLYQFHKPGSATHLLTTDYAEGALNNLSFDGTLGFVAP